MNRIMEVRLQKLTKVFVDKEKKETRAVDRLDVVFGWETHLLC